MSEQTGFHFEFPLFFIANRTGRIPTFRDMLRRRWFFLFTSFDMADLWLQRAEAGSVVLQVSRLAPICEFCSKNMGAGFVFNPTPIGTAAGVLPLERALQDATATRIEDDEDASLIGLELDTDPLS